MNKTERFREIVAKREDEWGGADPYVWYETAPDTVVDVEGHQIKVIESTNFNVERTLRDAEYESSINWNIWVIVEFEGDLYRMTSVYNSWDSDPWEPWQRVEKRPVTTIKYVEVDNGN